MTMLIGIKRSNDMNKAISLLLCIFLLFPSLSYAACDFSSDVKENQDGTYTYSKECHIEVGKNFKKISLLNEKIDLLEKKIELKDLVITKQEERIQLWMDTSIKLNEKLQTYESTKSADKWISFGLGVGITILSVWAAGQILK